MLAYRGIIPTSASFFQTPGAGRNWSLGRLRMIHEVVVIQAPLSPKIPGHMSWQDVNGRASSMYPRCIPNVRDAARNHMK